MFKKYDHGKQLDNRELFLLSIYSSMGEKMTQERLVKIIQELLKSDASLSFLQELKREDLEKLVACVRARLDQLEK
jgi:hypothetical protein